MTDRDRKPKFRRGGGKAPDRRESGRRPAWRERVASADDPVILYGWHTVAAALANPQRRIRKLWLSENAARRLADDDIDTRVTPEIVRPSLIDQRLGPDAVHQGLLAEADPLPSPDIDTLPQQGIVLVLDQITDPHQCRRHHALGGGVRVQAIVTNRASQPGGDRGAGESRLRRARARASGHRAKSRARAHRVERPGLHDGRLDSHGSENLATSPCGSPWRWCSAPKARVAAIDAPRPAAWWRGSTCPAKSRASMSRTLRCWLSISAPAGSA